MNRGGYNLLVLSCSDRKRHGLGRCRAIDLYDGPYYRTIRKLTREGRLPTTLDIYIVSGKYGLIRADEMIEEYDRTIDLSVVEETDSRQRMRDLISEGYDSIFVNMGKMYLKHFSDILEGFTFAKGRIGQRNAQMKEWILSI